MSGPVPAPDDSPDDAHGDSMLRGLRKVPGSFARTYVAQDAKVMYESINKNACTSLKWMMADLAGEDLSGFRAGWSPFIAETEAIHNRELWKVMRGLNKLSREDRAQIHPDHGWFIFAVVRDPRLRMFSAWQNKVLIQNPHSRRWYDQWWYPRHPVTRESILEDFAKFVDFFDREREHPLHDDAHFRAQTELLAEEAIPYTRIYEIGEIKQLTQDLTAHLERVGHPGGIHLPRANPTPLRPIGALFENGVREQIEKIYADDMERFGHLWDFTRTENAEPWSDKDIAMCETESVLGYRIADLHRLGRIERAEHAESRKQIRALEAEVERLSVGPVKRAGLRARRAGGRARRRLAGLRRG